MAKKQKKRKKVSESQQEQTTKISKFLKAAWNIICKKGNTGKEFTNAALSLIVSLFLNVIAFVLALVAVYGLVDGAIGIIGSMTISVVGVVHGLLQCVIAIVMGLFALILRGVANEVDRETDVNHLLALFSGVTSFAALIVALISLIRG